MPPERFVNGYSIHDRLLRSIERSPYLNLGRLGIFPISFHRADVRGLGTLTGAKADAYNQDHKQERMLHDQRWSKFDETSAE